MAGLERGDRASVLSSIIRPFCKKAEQASFFKERVKSTAFRSSLSTKLSRRALNEPLLHQRGSEVPMLAARTNLENGGRFISFSGHIWPLFRGV